MAHPAGDVDDGAQYFWKARAQEYNKLDWATASSYEQAFLDAGHFVSSDVVLDAGCGTGIITKLLAPHIRKVVGLDLSPDMLSHASKDTAPNESYLDGNIYDLPFENNSFDKITARMVFHHLTDNIEKGAQECLRVLKPGGTFLLSEGVPPGEEIADWYTKMFRLKEERLTFSQAILTALLKKTGFRDITVIRHTMQQCSIKNWLEHSGLGTELQHTIMEMHRTMPPIGKKLYRATLTEDDVLVDLLFLILVARK